MLIWNGLMRATIVLFAIVQLLLRGVAVSHCHAHESLSNAADHGTRPHIHLTGRSRSSHDHGHQHGHSHRHNHHDESPTPNVPSPDHDESALYVGCEILTAAVARVELPAADRVSTIDSDFGRAADSLLTQFVAYSETGPPEGSIFATLDVLPHMLRL